MSSDSLTKKLFLNTSPTKSFDFFVDRINQWWPKEYTWSQDVLQNIIIENRENGKCYELGPYDFRVEWGRVLNYQAPESITFTWQISDKREPVPDPAKSSRVHVQFKSTDEDQCKLILDHSDFKNHGDGYIKYLQAMDSEYGWDYLLKCYQKQLENY